MKWIAVSGPRPGGPGAAGGILGVEAGYGLTGGGIVGIVRLDVELDEVASWTRVTAVFTPPDINDTVTVSVTNTRWMAVGAAIFIDGLTYIVENVDSPTQVTLRRTDGAIGGGGGGAGDGTITGVIAGTGLQGGGTTGTVTLNVDVAQIASSLATYGIGGVVVSVTQPATPSIGELWFNTTTRELRLWDGAAWVFGVISGGTFP